MKALLIAGIFLFFSCSPTEKFRKDKAAFDSSPVKQRFTSVADMNDSYFEIRENNYFEFYRQLFDSVKNTVYPGRYTTKGDTMHLHFYDRKGTRLLGNKALVEVGGKNILFFK